MTAECGQPKHNRHYLYFGGVAVPALALELGEPVSDCQCPCECRYLKEDTI